MEAYITLGLVAGLPIVLLMALRINATLVFLSLCLGNLLVEFVAGDAHSLLMMGAKHDSATIDPYVKAGLLLLPVILTAVFMIKTIKGGGKLFLNIFPAIGVGLVGALLAVPLLPPGLARSVTHNNIWTQAIRLETLIVGASTLVCLLFLWMQRPKHKKADEGAGKQH